VNCCPTVGLDGNTVPLIAQILMCNCIYVLLRGPPTRCN
jgi:hypothetical protein